MAYEGETKKPINKCPRCGEGSWAWKLYDQDFDPGHGGYQEYVCQSCGLHIYESYVWDRTEWSDD